MQFNTPTTKSEMYTTLDEIFNYYRIQREEYQEPVLGELILNRLEYQEQTQGQLIEKATALLAPKQEREVNELIQELNGQISAYQKEIEQIQVNAQEQIEKVNELYQESQQKIKATASKNGLINSSAYLDKITFLENQKNLQINSITQKKDAEQLVKTSAKTMLEDKLSRAENFYDSAHQKDITAKVIELTDQQDQLIREIFKYNNGLDEKEQRYRNTIYQARANLKLKYMEITVAEFSKDQLVEMGYYDDVIACVCGYYDTLVALDAYRDIANDKKLPIYLDDYYHNIVYMYGIRAGVFS